MLVVIVPSVCFFHLNYFYPILSNMSLLYPYSVSWSLYSVLFCYTGSTFHSRPSLIPQDSPAQSHFSTIPSSTPSPTFSATPSPSFNSCLSSSSSSNLFAQSLHFPLTAIHPVSGFSPHLLALWAFIHVL